MRRAVLMLVASLAMRSVASAQAQPADAKQPVHPGTIYMVGYSHLDTEWRWSYPIVIAHFIPNTMIDNLRLIAKYPNYTFNWSGANRYRMMKEYYPVEYAKVKQAVADGRWWPAGSAWEESLADEPSAEALVRQVLYGNEFFRRELGKASNEMMLPDTFGFPASLPTILAHCGLKGFSTQKLSWGSAVGTPFNVGKWTGPDGRWILAALDGGGYGTQVKNDPTTAKEWVSRLEKNGDRSGVYVDYRYYGTGDRGGAPDEHSVQLVNKAVSAEGPVKVVSATAAQMFDDLTPTEIAKLPNYTGELLLTQHSAGTPSSQAFQKWLNRKNELLADDAERASVAAALLGAAPYPMAKLTDGWHLLLGGQFHDILAGTELPTGIEFAWADGMLAQNELRTVRNDAVGAVSRGLDTRGQGVTVVLNNPLSVDREDVVETEVPVATAPAGNLIVVGPDGRSVPAQLLSWDAGVAHVAVLAKVPSIGFAAYDVRFNQKADNNGSTGELKVTADSLENHRYLVKVDANGDVSSIFDKKSNCELLTAPARLALLHDAPQDWPAWNVDYVDRTSPPIGYVDESTEISIAEKGPARVALAVKRTSHGSTFIQHIRLAAGEAGNRVEFDTDIDWHTPGVSLKATFPLVVSNPKATYNWEAGTVERGNNDPKKYEVPSHQWFDLTNTDGNYGVSVLEDCKYASDKPDDHTLRLTLLRTPGVRGKGYTDQGSQDFGRHHILYALQGHAGDWRVGDTQWEAMRLNQPLTSYVAQPHEGALGKSFSLLSLNTKQVAVRALKWAEDGNHIIVRLQELTGQPAKGVTITPAAGSITEVDGQERPIGAASNSIDLGTYSLRAFSIAPWHPGNEVQLQPALSTAIDLPFNLDAITPQPPDDLPGAKQEPVAANRGASDSFDDEGNTLPGEMLPASLQVEGITFKFGHAGSPNAVACHGQKISLPAGDYNRVYLLAAASDGPHAGQFHLGDTDVSLNIQDWGGYVGLSDNRIFKGNSPEIDYNGTAHFAGLTPGYIRLDPVAWYSSHRHGSDGKNQIYKYAYLFKYRIDVPKNATSLTLPDEPHIKILAATAAHNDADAIVPPNPRMPWQGLDFTNPTP